MRALTILAFLLAALAAPVAQAQSFDDPRALVEHVYAPYLADEVPSDYPAGLFTATLRQLWDEMEQRAEAEEMPGLGFDPFINGQDFQLSDFSVVDPLIDGDSARIVVTFHNFGTPQEIHFSLVREAGGWLIDDLEQVEGDIVYRLSELLADDPLLN